MNVKILSRLGVMLAVATNLWAGQVLQLLTADGEIRHVSNSTGQRLVEKLLELPSPPIQDTTYAVTGLVQYEDVEGEGYLEMTSHFGPREAYFSRTLAASGPMKALQGSSPWREFHLPFHRNPDTPPPDRLVIQVVLPGNGSVMLSALKLVEGDPLSQGSAWLTPQQANWLGGVLGSLVGITGALIGILAGFGRARAFNLILIDALLVCGVVLAVAGGIVWGMGQPFHVYYPLLLTGGIVIFVLGLNRGTTRKAYEARELRRMQAVDA